MIDVYVFATTNGSFSAEGLLDDQDAIEMACTLGDRGETVISIFKGGRLWLNDAALKSALIDVAGRRTGREPPTI